MHTLSYYTDLINTVPFKSFLFQQVLFIFATKLIKIEMKNKSFVDCFMLMGTALSMKGGSKLPDMGRPLIQDVFTTFVNLSATIEEFKILDIKNMDFVIDGLLNQRWVDPRLGANIRTRKMAVAGQIWKPMVTNTNGLNRIPNKDDTVFWRGFGDEGNILLSEKFQIEGSCTIDFHNFPFDQQFCQVKFGSYRFPNDEVSVVWDDIAINLFSKIKTNEFHLANISTHVEIDIRLSGNFSTAVIQFTLQRKSMHYVICTATPCMAMVLVNYLSFWFSICKRTMRLNILFFSFIVNLYFYYSSICLIQPVPYLKALDIFVGICMSFSIFSLLETFTIDFLCTEEEEEFHLKKKACSKEYPKSIYWIEMGMKIGYPVFYTFFVAIFCAVFISSDV